MIALLLLAKATAITALGLAGARWGRDRLSAGTRHAMWAAVVTALLLLPMMALALPDWTVWRLPTKSIASPSNHGVVINWRAQTGQGDRIHEGNRSASVAGRPERFGSGIAWTISLGLLYISIASLLITRILWMHRIARRRLRSATRITSAPWIALVRGCCRQLRVSRVPDLFIDPVSAVPMTLGTRRPAIVLPPAAEQWSLERRRAVLLHELAHVTRLDCLTQMLAGITCALYWIHPGAWWAAHRLKIEREFACDDLAVAAGCDRRDYATHLLELAYAVGRSRVAPPALAMASGSGLESRLAALLDADRRRQPPAWRTALAAATIVLVLFVAVGTATVATGDQSTRSSAQRRGTISLSAARAWLDSAMQRAGAWAATQFELIDELQRQHYSWSNPLDLVTLSKRGVDVDFVRRLDGAGYHVGTVSRLIDFADHGVTPEFIREIGETGLGRLSPEELLLARRHGVDADFVRELASLGYPSVTLDQLLDSRRHGVDGAFIQEMAAAGYAHLSLDDLKQLRRHGVDGDRARDANQQAGRTHSVSELVSLASRGRNGR